jgi:hypothetical protein
MGDETLLSQVISTLFTEGWWFLFYFLVSTCFFGFKSHFIPLLLQKKTMSYRQFFSKFLPSNRKKFQRLSDGKERKATESATLSKNMPSIFYKLLDTIPYIPDFNDLKFCRSFGQVVLQAR